MFNRKKEDEAHPLDETIMNLIQGIAGLQDGSEEQTRAIGSLKTLMETRNADIQERKGDTVSVDTITSIAANLLSIGLILGFEKANVITTKSLSFVPRMKI